MTVDVDYSRSWYAATRDRVKPRPILDTAVDADVCVVGGGLAGLSAAWELVRQGAAVVLLEARQIGWGASGRNGGFVSPGFSCATDRLEHVLGRPLAQRLYAYSMEGAEQVRQNVMQFAPHCMMGEGKLTVSRYPAATGMQQTVARLNAHYNEAVEYLAPDALRQLIDSKRYFGGIFKAHGFHIHPLNYALALADEAEHLGTRLFERSAVLAIEPAAGLRRGNRWRVITGAGSVSAAHLVLCTGGYDNGLYRPVSRAILPVATHVVVTEPLSVAARSLIRTQCAIADTGNACDYYRIIDRERLMWGGKITTRIRPPSNLVVRMKRAMTEVFPALESVKIDYSWSGLMAYCRHRMPLLRNPEPGLWLATAFGGHGLNTTAMAGQLVASALIRGDDRWRDFDRFGLDWNAGHLGQAVVQASYWRMQAADRLQEWKADRGL